MSMSFGASELIAEPNKNIRMPCAISSPLILALRGFWWFRWFILPKPFPVQSAQELAEHEKAYLVSHGIIFGFVGIVIPSRHAHNAIYLRAHRDDLEQLRVPDYILI